ncbi:MAG: hypothetical protein D6692_04680 [Planctomycetota bacterium]|nr:MAG: hypothetical protein D6692_04680 [Planctomycetota bacterium]
MNSNSTMFAAWNDHTTISHSGVVPPGNARSYTEAFRLNGFGTATAHDRVSRYITPASTGSSAAFTVGPASTTFSSLRQSCGGLHTASPPSGHITISSASPPTARHIRQCPNSCNSTSTNNAAIAGSRNSSPL